MKLLGNRQSDCAPDATADDTYLFKIINFGGYAERSDEIPNEIPFVLMVEFFGCRTDDLEDYLNGSAFAVIARNRKRYSFTFLIDTENYELTGLGFGGNKRSFNFHERYGGVEAFFCYDFIHKSIPFHKVGKASDFRLDN